MELLPIAELEKMVPVFRGRAGNALAGLLLKALRIKDVEREYNSLAHLKGAELARGVLDRAGMDYTVNGLPRKEAMAVIAQELPEGPFITISNHPMGHLDGMALIDFFGHIRDDYKYMVNDILGRFESLQPSLITVNPTGAVRTAPTARSIAGIRLASEHLQAGHPLGLFPSGAVSDLKPGKRPSVQAPGPDGTITYTEPRIRDREWQMPIVKFIAKAGVPVLPVRILDGNSRFYYNLGLIDWRVRLLRLPAEMFNKAGKTARIVTGPLISADRIAACESLPELRTLLRAAVYSLNYQA